MTGYTYKGVYVGFMPCGCMVAFCADIAGMEKDTAKSVADFICSGYRVEHMSVDDYDACMKTKTWPLWTRCPHGANPKTRKLSALETKQLRPSETSA